MPAEECREYDPARGWWMLNLGRNFIYPTESLYHALVLGIALCVSRRAYWWAVLVALALGG